MDGAADEDRLGRVPISAATRRPTAMPSTIFLAFASIGLAGNEQKKKEKKKRIKSTANISNRFRGGFIGALSDISPDLTGLYLVLNGVYWVKRGFTLFYWVLLGFYLVLLGFT